MDNERLEKIFKVLADDIQGEPGRWQFTVDSITFMCLTDEYHNRMRIISPAADLAAVTSKQMKECLEANFHTALDIKYAIAEDVMRVVFIHPLKELSVDQVVDAVEQIYSGVQTFGTYYSGGTLEFPSRKKKRKIYSN